MRRWQMFTLGFTGSDFRPIVLPGQRYFTRARAIRGTDRMNKQSALLGSDFFQYVVDRRTWLSLPQYQDGIDDYWRRAYPTR